MLRALLTSDANIIPQPDEGILRIQLLGLGSAACDRMLMPLIEELNATATIYPGTELRLVYELTANPLPDVSPDSGSGQEVRGYAMLMPRVCRLQPGALRCSRSIARTAGSRRIAYGNRAARGVIAPSWKPDCRRSFV